MTVSDSTQPTSAAELAAAINGHAEAFEEERARRAKAADERREAQRKRMERRWWFLFATIIFMGLLLAYRTETNNQLLREQQFATDQRFYQACIDRRDRQVNTNVSREELVQLAADRKVPPLASGIDRDAYVAQLRQALLVLVEDCGDPPAPRD